MKDMQVELVNPDNKFGPIKSGWIIFEGMPRIRPPLCILGQARRGRAVVPAGAARQGEGMGPEHTPTLDTTTSGSFTLIRASPSRPNRCTGGRHKATRKH